MSRSSRRDKAVIYLPIGQGDALLDLALTHCRNRDYEIDSVVPNYGQAVALAVGEFVTVIVVGTRAHLDPQRVPRVEVADELIDVDPAPIERRPRRSPGDGPPPS